MFVSLLYQDSESLKQPPTSITSQNLAGDRSTLPKQTISFARAEGNAPQKFSIPKNKKLL
ncbi:MAG: hypothetical protein LH702_18090 [Phormidesmis sp. CAN_BIN44]|nr:hypothetical protein [Phormidesmis sp. CAN_BIN44]